MTPSAACLTSIHIHCAEQTSGSKTGWRLGEEEMCAIFSVGDSEGLN